MESSVSSFLACGPGYRISAVRACSKMFAVATNPEAPVFSRKAKTSATSAAVSSSGKTRPVRVCSTSASRFTMPMIY